MNNLRLSAMPIKCYREDDNPVYGVCSFCHRVTCKEHGKMDHMRWYCEQHNYHMEVEALSSLLEEARHGSQKALPTNP